jgi:chemotaxis protein MotB
LARKKRGGGHGGHGWFVTFADLMALLMSFFVMVAAYSTQDQKKLQLVAGSMRDAFGVSKESRYAGIIEQDGIPTRSRLKNPQQVSPEKAADHTRPVDQDPKDDGLSVAFNREFGLAAASLRQAMQEMPEIAELSKNIIIEETKEGLNISLVDQDGRSMFPEGSTQPYDRTRRILERISASVRRMPNRIAVTGHTAALRPGGRNFGSPWDLSAGRAIVVREILATSGVPDDRFSVVSGRSDTEPMFPDNPYLAANRRVTVTLLKEAPPIPYNQKP